MTEIHKRIEAHIPSLRRYARALVRDVAGADDLVQECLTRALSKLDLWCEGLKGRVGGSGTPVWPRGTLLARVQK